MVRPGLRGFTLIELLIVIAVIALLIGLLLPALGKAREAGRSVREQSNIRSVNQAFTQYTLDFQDEVLPGRMPKYWVMRIYTCDVFMHPTDPEDRTRFLTDNAMRTWVWRLAGHHGVAPEAMWFENPRDVEAFRARGPAGRSVNGQFVSYSDSSWVGAVATHPAFGMNTTFVGGDSNHSAFKLRGQTRCNNLRAVPGTNLRTQGGMFYVQRADQVRDPSNLITFAGSRGGDVSGTSWHSNATGLANSTNPTNARDGFFKVRAPLPHPVSGPDHGTGFSLEPGWASNSGTRFDRRQPESTWGYLNARFFNTVAVAKFDNSVERMTLAQLRNMRHWDNYAAENTNAAGVYTWRGR